MNHRSIFILRKAGKAPLPVIFSCDGYDFNLLTVGVEADGNGIRAFPVLIVGIVPRLAAGEVNFRRGMAVCYHKARRGIAGNYAVVAVHRYFLNSVNDLLAVLVLIQISKNTHPAIFLAQGKYLPGVFPICQQLNRNFSRPQTVLIVCVIPCLRHGDTGLARRITVCNIEAIYL